ncbi:hypothetical protein [Roseobacter sp. AzwK-3b]|uniref:hypothetical protein n=1 Tax=Roseobacter sp. AzwK-3b TaxID=351016 RepID=UPI00056115C6|nr:hypothetical protein [Roseobacter sp. AzwK-3b]
MIKNDILIAMLVTVLFVSFALLSFQINSAFRSSTDVDIQKHATLIYLPHGVIVLTAWLYGWKSVAYLFPGQLITHILYWGPENFYSSRYFDLVAGACIGYVGVLVAVYVLENKKAVFTKRPWVEILLAGVIAALVNAAIKSLAYSVTVPELFEILSGDLIGLLLLMFGLLLIFKVERRLRSN